MEKEKLYYTDPLLRAFATEVTDCREADGGWEITLRSTAFYPGGGGQACDTGTLGEARVTAVYPRGETICHLCDRPLEPGQTVTGRLDWEARFDRMQQHSGEHIVSGILHEKFGLQNVGFHMGETLTEIDFDGPVPPQALEEVEQLANQAVFADLPIRCWYPDPQTLARTPYRSKKQLAWPVRLVQIPGIDSCACCGVHTATTGQIGLIKLVSMEKFHQGVRIRMCCGGRALTLMQAVFTQNRLVARALSAQPLETGEAAARLCRMLEAERARANKLQSEALEAQARALAGRGSSACFRPELTAEQAWELTEKTAAVCGGWAAVLTGGPDTWQVSLAGPAAAVQALGQALKTRLGARGGGKPGCFRGSVGADRAGLEALLAEFL